MENFKEICNYIFDILKLENITGLDAIKYCQLFIGIRNVTKELLSKFDIPLEYLYDNFCKDKKGIVINDDNLILKKFYNPDINKPSYLKFIIEKGNFYQFNFKIESAINFINIYKKLDNLNIVEIKSNNDFDIYGIIYQLYLDKCNSITKKELGINFTDRNLVKYMIDLCNPTNTETILDPSCGTGGFLSMTVKYLNNKYPNINWSINKKNIYGFDDNTICKNLTTASLLIETGELFNTTINYRDTLCDDYKINNTLIDKVDIIMCDIPFGIRNFKFASACSRIKQLKFDGTKAEPLFLQLILQSLNKNGRGAIIVPDNLLENNAKLHTKTRQYLLENLNLKKVVSIDSKLINLGIKQSIIYFENNTERDNIEFSRLVYENNKCIEEPIINVKYSEINKSHYYLYPSLYTRTEKSILSGVSGSSNMKIKDFYTCTILDKVLDNKEYIIINHNSIQYNGDLNNNKHIVITINTENNSLKLKYIYYYLLSIKKSIFTNYSSKNSIYIDYINNIEIPMIVPELKSKIIYNLELCDKQIDINNQSINNYNDIIKNISWSYCYKKTVIKLSSLGKINIVKSIDPDSDSIYINKNANILLMDYSTEPFSFIPYISITINNELINIKYLYYCLKYNNTIQDIIHSSTISKSGIEDLEIPILTLKDQYELIGKISKLLNNIKLLKLENNELLDNNIINKILDDGKNNNLNDNHNNSCNKSSCSATSINMNIECN
jgi:type I restriction-modification system DNA methylase subunit